MSTAWQKEIRRKNYYDDLRMHGLTEDDVKDLTVKDFTLVPLYTDDARQEAKEFIIRHEWLGNLTQYTTHWFGAYYGNILAGVVLMSIPNAFSKMLGDNTHDIERLISRGACISWSPKNLGSALIMYSIKWMARNTRFRLFTAYADPTANELGTIYQACNFYYLGQKFGTTKRYVSPHTGKVVSDRYFRQKTAYKRFAKELGITWQKGWTRKTGVNWGAMPAFIKDALKKRSKQAQAEAEEITYPAKHKYAYVLGANKKETKQLRKEFLRRNKVYNYPTEEKRGV